MEFYLGIDLGTSYFKTGIIDNDKNLIGLGRCAVNKQTEGDVICELPIADFWTTLRECIEQALQQSGVNRGKIQSISYSSQANSFVLLDEKFCPLTPLILWTDERAEDIPSAVKTLIQKPEFQRETGLGILPGVQSMISKIVWFQEHKPEVWKKVKSIMTISDYLTFCLTGKAISDFSTSSMTGLFNIKQEKWWNEALEILNINEGLLSVPRRTGTYVGTLSKKGANQLGLSQNTKFFLGGLDHHMVAVGSGLPGSNNVSESTGTVLATVNYQKGYNPQDGINIAPGIGEGHYFQMAFNENGATSLEWYQKTFAPDFTINTLLKMAEEISPGSDGLVALPCADKYEGLAGFKNVEKKHSHGHFIRALLESTGFSLQDLINKLDTNNLSGNVISSGGGARSFLWTQIKADILNRTFVLPKSSELACQGAALIGMNSMPRLPLSHKNQDVIVNPDPNNVENYKKQLTMKQKLEKKAIIDRAKQSLRIESKAISDIIDYLDEDSFVKAVEVMSSCPKIITCASGSSGIAAKKFAHSLCCIERNAQFLSPAEAIHGGMGCMKKGDAVIMVSRGGKTAELLPIIDVCNKKEVILIGVTENLNSPLAKSSQIVVPMKIEKESDGLNVMATSSFVATIAIFDAMLAALMDVTDYTLEQFALIHPGGAVGDRLNK